MRTANSFCLAEGNPAAQWVESGSAVAWAEAAQWVESAVAWAEAAQWVASESAVAWAEAAQWVASESVEIHN